MAHPVPPRRAHGDEPKVPGRGRPMSRETEQAILRSTAELLEQRGLSEISLDEIATRARVSKASIYRRWPSKGTLAFDAFMVQFLDVRPEPDTGRLEDDLLEALRGWVRAVDGTKTGRTLRGLIAEVQRDPGLAEAWRERFLGPLRARHLAIVQRAAARGELAADADAGLLLDLLYGPAYYRLLQGHLPLDEPFVTRVVATIMAAIRAGVL